MNIETIKTVVLTILVLISILLTFGLWYYQPDYERLHNTASDYVNEVDIGGKEVTKKDVIQPRQIIFHKGENYFGFANIKDEESLYKDMQEWIFHDFQTSNVTYNPSKNNEIEVIFPTPIPMELVGTLFTFHEEFTNEDQLPSWSFNRVFISFNEAQSTLSVNFRSVDGREQSSATVNNSTIYNNLMLYMTSNEGLTEYVVFNDEADNPIYIQAAPVEMNRWSLAVESIESSLLVDALFSNPTLVSHNIRESSFSDGQRALNVLQEGRSMEYYNPIESTSRMESIEILDKSISNINDHKGWTEEYHLSDIDQSKSKVQYQMHYDGYPIYSNAELSMIEQQWREQDLHFYRRLLFSLNDSLGRDSITLHAGTEVNYYLKNNSNFNVDKIDGIQVGYKLTYLEDASYSVVLEPAWYMDYDNNWVEIRFDEFEKHDKGGG